MDRFYTSKKILIFFSRGRLEHTLAALAADYLNKYFKHVYLKCGNVLVSFKVNIQW